MNQRTVVIAEAGVNHNGDISIAKQLVDAAALAGADYVKFQTFSAERMVTPTAGKAGYQKQTTDASESQYEMLKNLELSDEMHDQLISHCMSRGIQFLSTGFDIESVDFLLSLGQKLIKIPSGEITNLPLLRHIGGFGFPIILSTGMSTIQETGDALAILESAGALRSQTTVLHCTSEYPAPMNEVNLRAMRSIADTFGVDVGYSDHTLGIEVSIAAVSLGAKVIEKHFTLDRNLPGPDHKASLDPVELIEMIKSIRNIELALGDGIKCPTSSERKNLSAARKSIVAKCKIELGETFSNRNLDVKRSGDGVSPMNWDLIVGQKASREYQINEMIEM
jgi:N,N'-diacetyllegionaminate synthase